MRDNHESARSGRPEQTGRGPRRYILAGQPVEAPALAGGLHLVATPIGNLRDITLRALEVLASADVIACEDTRVTRKLLDHYGIATPLTPYHEHNASIARPKLLARLAAGEAVALVSDAGTPLISDPGFKLVRAAHEAGHSVTALPGASAALAALIVAGLPTDRFFFEGFLPAKEGQRRARIAELARIPASLILFETGPRLARALSDLAAGLGAREAAICRELTKLYEEVRRGDLATLARDYADEPPPRGEIVIVIAPPAAESGELDADAIDEMLRRALGRASVKDAVGEVAAATGLPRREVYQRALGAQAMRTTMARRIDGRGPGTQAPRPERQVAFRLGLSAESRAAAYLIAKGYRIVARRWRSPVGEVDIVARRRQVLVFVEVKARARLDDAAESVTERQQRRIAAAAAAWLAEHPDDAAAISDSTPCWWRPAVCRVTSWRPSKRNSQSRGDGESCYAARSRWEKASIWLRMRAAIAPRSSATDLTVVALVRVFSSPHRPGRLLPPSRWCGARQYRRCARSPASRRPVR